MPRISKQIWLPCRAPFDGPALIHFLRAHAVPGMEDMGLGADASGYRRTLRLRRGDGAVALLPEVDGIHCLLELSDVRDEDEAVQQSRRLIDATADPVEVHDVLGRDPDLANDLVRHPGLRVPGCSDGFELAVRAVLGQQVSLASARVATQRFVQAIGTPLSVFAGGLTHLFPTAEEVVAAGPEEIRGPRARARTVVRLAEAVVAGSVVLDGAASRPDTVAALLGLPGIGPWTAGYVAMRALGDPDIVLETDVGLHAAVGLRGRAAAVSLRTRAVQWQPRGSYACMLLWQRVLDSRSGGSATQRL